MLVACQECGAQISETALACPSCGAPPEVFLGESRPCSECGESFCPAFGACPSCGASSSISVTSSAPAGAPVPPLQSAVLPKPPRIAERAPRALAGSDAQSKLSGPYTRILTFLFSPRGRVSRKQLWQFYGVCGAIGFLMNSWAQSLLTRENVVGLLNPSTPTALSVAMGVRGVVGILMLSLLAIVIIKRFHDRGMSGWWTLWAPLIAWAPFIAFKLMGVDIIELGSMTSGTFVAWYFGVIIVFFVILSILPGQRGENRFGRDPLGSG